MTATDAATVDPPAAGDAIPFPSVAWFERLGALMAEQRDRFRHLGTVDCVMGVSILGGGPGGGDWHGQVTFEEFNVGVVREVDEEEITGADFIVETDLDTWREMIENIAAHGGHADLEHTLNYLSLPGTPIRVWSDDPIRRDAFFRFNQTLQEFIENCATFPTRFGQV